MQLKAGYVTRNKRRQVIGLWRRFSVWFTGENLEGGRKEKREEREREGLGVPCLVPG